ncbi:hypothetical protein ACFLTH_08940 [Bacteroidota bacterium]
MITQTKKGTASGAAILVILITVVLVFYILFLPPEDRAELLGEENKTSDDNKQTDSGYNKTLLKENIGRLDYLKFDYREYDIPSFRVYSEESGTEIKKISSLYIKSAMGEHKTYNTTFELNKRLTSNVKLAFNVADSKGRLTIYLNGREIFSGALKEGSPSPIDLPSNLLDYENELSFYVSKPGIAFWRTNRYTIENLIITGDILDVSHSTSRQYFYVSEVEKLNLETIKLKYYPVCDVSTTGTLDIYLNGHETFSGIADCGIYNTLFLDVDAVYEGKNELEFVASEGSYLFDRVSVRTELDELLYPVYYFDLDEELFYKNDLKDDFNVTLQIRFVNDDDKRMEFLINGRRRHISTDEIKYTTKLDDYVLPETNSLELVPQSIIDIAELKVLLDED